MWTNNAAHQRDGAFKLMTHSLRTWFLGFSYYRRLLLWFSWFCFHQEIWKMKYNRLKTTVFPRLIKIGYRELLATPNLSWLQERLKNKGKVNIHMAQIMELNRNLANIKNSSSLTYGTINIVFISHVISHSSSFSVAQDNADLNI